MLKKRQQQEEEKQLANNAKEPMFLRKKSIKELIAPKTPNGANFITKSVNLNITSQTLCKKSRTGRAFWPTAHTASAKNIANTTICNKSPFAIDSTMLTGTEFTSICII